MEMVRCLSAMLQDSQQLFECSLPMIEDFLITALNAALAKGAGDIGCVGGLEPSVSIARVELHYQLLKWL